MPALTVDRPDHQAPAVTTIPGCDACPHPLAAHDAIGLRFCRATTASTLDRGCVCPSA